MTPNDVMREQLKKDIVPYLRSIGFKGSFPHFRRSHDVGIDLLTFQFDKWGRPSFCVEYAFTSHFISSEGMPTKTPKNVNTFSINQDNRRRLNPSNLTSKKGYSDYWYSYKEDTMNQRVEQVSNDLQIPIAWWAKMADEERVTSSPPAVVGNVSYLIDGQIVSIEVFY